MISNANLSTKHAPLSYLRASCDADLCRHYSVAAYLVIMTYLYQVVYLYAAMNYGSSHDGSVHTTIGTYLNVIFNDGDANLRYLLVAFFSRFEAKTIGTNDTTGMKDTTIANDTIVINDRITVNLCVRSYFSVPAYRNMRMKDTAFAYLHTFGNSNKRTNVALLPYLCRRIDESEVADAFPFGLHTFVYLQELCHCLASIRHLDKSSFYILLKFKILIDKYHTTFCLIEISFILLIIQETDATWLSFFYLGEVVNLGIGVTYDGASYQSCYHLCCEFHVSLF